ncbi:DNA ligase D [Sphingosinicellaceae bacterium]|nr:DNA ligase D [Sphingosinicellaceae bacterium]
MSDSLATYNAKRDFKKTREPAGEAGRATGNSFMVQKHAATRLHWDFRLELDGVLLSWAVTRGPSTNPEDKRLAVRTEDHPLSYATFEGTIPAGEYGGGTVMLWDRGTWEPQDDPRVGLKKGKLHFTLHGERMKGEWVLVRLKPEGKRENWLMRKVEDEFATGDLGAEHMTSVESARTMEAITNGEKSAAKGATPTPTPSLNREGSSKTKRVPANEESNPAKRVRLPEGEGLGVGTPKPRAKDSAKPPAFQDPQLATLVDTPPTGNDWLHETKYDGYRALVAVGGGKCIAYTRSGLDWTTKFRVVADAAAKLPCSTALIDCEIVALDNAGKPSFGALQNALKDGGPILAFAFDLLELDGTDVAALPLVERKARLAHLLEGIDPPLHYSEHVRGGGEKLFAALCAGGYEGVISKKADVRYRAGRAGTWLKSKCLHRQEFVIGGWSTSEKGRGFASLLLGIYEGEKFVYAGRVGTGFDDKTLEDLTAKLAALKADKPAYADKLPALARRGANWVRPELVAEVAFTEFTGDGHLRHPSFLGLRADKPAREVVRELTQGETVPEGKPAAKAKAAPKLAPASTGSGVVISSPDRIVFPELGMTKGALAAYYETVSAAMMPDLARRAISLVRCPQGRAKQCFFQKHDSGMFPDSVHSVEIAESGGKTEPYLYVEDSAGLLACVQMGTIEFHGWGSRVDDIERPDRLVIDLDPDEAVSFEAVKLAAELVRDRLKSRGLDSAPMLSGGKGVHVVAPLVPRAEWPEVKAWCKAFAESLEAEAPDAFVAVMSKAKRKGRIFVDYLRNQRGATAVLPYSVRARAGAGVAVPVTWAELREVKAANLFSAADPAAVLAQAARKREPAKARPLPKA